MLALGDGGRCIFRDGCPWRRLLTEDHIAFGQLEWVLTVLQHRVEKQRSPGSESVMLEVDRWDFDTKWYRLQLETDLIPVVLWRECRAMVGLVAAIANNADKMDEADYQRRAAIASAFRRFWRTPEGDPSRWDYLVP